MKCNICNCNESIVKEYEKNFNVKGKMIKETIESRFCKNCGNLLYDENLDNIALRKIIKKYLKNYGIEPERIVELRKKYDISQELFSKIIGCAKKTLISYEKGYSIPNDNYLIIIKTLLYNEDVIMPLIESNKDNFTEKEYKMIENKLCLNNSYKTKNRKLNEYNGYTEISYEKIKNIILYLTRNGLHKTKLLKELFYIDFKCYKEYGYSMTGMEYVKITYGPVPDNYEIILNELIKNNYLKLNIINHDNYEENILNSMKNSEMNSLSENEIKIINSIEKKFKNYLVSDIVNYSHEEEAYKKTKNKELISYDYSFDLKA